MANKILIGSHVSFKSPGYLEEAARESIEQGANSMMIYLGSPQMSFITPYEKTRYEQYIEKHSNELPLENIVVHCPYIINPASVTKYQFAIDFLIEEINQMDKMKLKYLVLHPGSATSFTVEESIDTLVKVLKEVFAKTNNVEILLETMAGKGNELGRNFEQLKAIIDKVNDERLGVCLDTCHVWESGLDLRNYDLLIDEINKYNLLPTIKVIHLNDSKNPLGAKKDRHENIGKGHIGFEPLRKIIHSDEFASVIKILETPYVDDKPIYKQEIAMLLK